MLKIVFGYFSSLVHGRGQIVNNSAGGCSIAIKFCTDYDHVPPDLQQTFKVNGLKVRVMRDLAY